MTGIQWHSLHRPKTDRLTGAQRLLRGEAQGLAIDLADMSMVIRDAVTPSNNFEGDPNNKLTYTAPSTKYVRDAFGRVLAGTTIRPAFSEDGLNLGAAIESAAATNLLLRSQEFDNAAWTKTSVTATADTIAAPDGTTTADTLAATGANGTVAQNGAASATNSSRAFAVWLRRKTGTGTVSTEVGASTLDCTALLDANAWRRFTMIGASINGTYALVSNVITVTATAHGLNTGDAVRVDITSGAAADASVASVTRVDANTFTYAQVAADTSGNCTIHPNVARIKIATNTDEVYAWGAQLENPGVGLQGNQVSSYIPTTSATATRAADTITLATSLFPYSQAGNSSLFVRIRLILSNSTFSLVAFDDGTSNEFVRLIHGSGGSFNFAITDGGVSQANSNFGTNFDINVTHQAAVRWGTNDVAVVAGNSATLVTDTSATMPTPTTLKFGHGTGAIPQPHWLEKFLYIPRGMPDAELRSRALRVEQTQ